MTRPRTAEHPGDQPAPATQRRNGKGRPAKAGTGRGRAAPEASAAGKDEAAELLRRLTAREAQAFAHLAAGRDLAETAAALGVTTATARGYQHRALRKLGTRTQDEITALAALLPATAAGGGQPPSEPCADSAAAAAPQQASTAASEQAPSDPCADHTNTAAPPSRQAAVRRPVANAAGANRPQGVRPGRDADADADAGAGTPPQSERAEPSSPRQPPAGAPSPDRAAADTMTTAHRSRPTAKQPAHSVAVRTAAGREPAEPGDRPAAKQPAESVAARAGRAAGSNAEQRPVARTAAAHAVGRGPSGHGDRPAAARRDRAAAKQPAARKAADQAPGREPAERNDRRAATETTAHLGRSTAGPSAGTAAQAAGRDDQRTDDSPAAGQPAENGTARAGHATRGDAEQRPAGHGHQLAADEMAAHRDRSTAAQAAGRDDQRAGDRSEAEQPAENRTARAGHAARSNTGQGPTERTDLPTDNRPTAARPGERGQAPGTTGTERNGDRAASHTTPTNTEQGPAERTNLPADNKPTATTPGERGQAPGAAAAERNGDRAAGQASAAPGRGGGAEAGFEEVYEAAYTRLVQQVFLLTACKHRAVHCVGRAFAEARLRWAEVAAGGEPEGWVRARAFESALSPWHRGGPRRTHVWRLPYRRIKVRPADEAQAVLPDHDRLTDRDRALLKALRRLSRPQRRARVLHDGLGMPAAAVALEVEATVAGAEGRVWAARAALAHWVPELVGPDPAADGFADRLCVLMHRAAVRGAPEPHRAPVPVLRARHGLVNAGRTGAAALLTAAVGGAVVATLAGGGPGELFRPPGPPPPSLCAPVPTSATGPDALLPLLADGPPSGIESLWCSPTPGLEPVVVDPPPPRADGPYRPPAGGRAAEALPPPGAGAAAPPRGCGPAWA
ncbi:hypothetical protein ACFXAF_34575, partial [Kitasatospora sp. NPDC059463]|uniref:hypothetical protein n=1 Tax=Kitasatospora sp. NPDC059463 TaxID=3346842 RepID=UPI00369288A6